MRCEEFEQLWHCLLDSRTPPDDAPQIALHAAECDSCRMLLIGWDALEAGCAAYEIPPLSPEFAQRVVALSVPARTIAADSAHALAAAVDKAFNSEQFVEESEPSAPHARNRRLEQAPCRAYAPSEKRQQDSALAPILMVAGLAASLLLMLSLSPSWQHGEARLDAVRSTADGLDSALLDTRSEDETGHAPTVAASDSAKSLAAELVAEAASKRAGSSEDREASKELGSPGLSDRLGNSLPREVLAMLDLPSLQDSEAVRTMEHVAEGLRPIASSVGHTLDRLRQTIPGRRTAVEVEKPQAARRPIVGHFS